MTSLFDLNDLLRKAGVDPQTTLVMRHQPFEPALRKALPVLAVEAPEVFNAYQQTQNLAVERKLGHAKHLISCVAHGATSALLVGVYEIRGAKPISHREYWDIPEVQELKKLGIIGFTGDRPSILWWDLALTEYFASWCGKLVIEWSNPISWCRSAHKNSFPVSAILGESALVRPIPHWKEMVVAWPEIHLLPLNWRAALSQWRGIYYICDTRDGKGYVGAAYGRENLLQRWHEYARTGHGGNHLLRERDPETFVFSILELIAPDADVNAVAAAEKNWKDRLGTRASGLNSN